MSIDSVEDTHIFKVVNFREFTKVEICLPFGACVDFNCKKQENKGVMPNRDGNYKIQVGENVEKARENRERKEANSIRSRCSWS